MQLQFAIESQHGLDKQRCSPLDLWGRCSVDRRGQSECSAGGVHKPTGHHGAGHHAKRPALEQDIVEEARWPELGLGSQGWNELELTVASYIVAQLSGVVPHARCDRCI